MSQDSTSVSSDLSDLKLPEEPRLDGLVIGIPREYHCPGVSSEVVDMWTKVADIMEDSGAEVCCEGLNDCLSHSAVNFLDFMFLF